MQKITATELARNLRAILDRVGESGGEYIVTRGNRAVARVVPTPGEMNAEQAMADLYRTLDEAAAETWSEDARKGADTLSDESRDPWER